MSQVIDPPADQFELFELARGEALGDRRVSHLLRRGGFGADVEQLNRYGKDAPKVALDWLLDYDPKVDPLAEEFQQLIGFVNTNSPQPVQEWWLYRMLYSDRPLQEKVALFWHGRFATSLNKVEQPMVMHKQIDLFRRMGLGNYRELLVALGHDPAMLIWLDGRYNRKGKPNENYGRELMELFTLGIGHYTESDVKELARCFTGWQLKEGEAFFDEKQFDTGEKTVFGKKGNFDSESAIDVILQRPEASRYLATNLLKEFVHPEPTKEQIDHYSQMLVAEDWEIKPVLRSMLSSRMFFSEWAYRSKIKSPIEMVVGACHSIGGRVSTAFVRDQCSKMGQNLLYPPTVKGWDGQEMWINANTVLLRFNVGLAMASQRNNEFPQRADLEAFLSKHNIKSAEDIVNHYARLLLDGKLSDEAKAKLLDYMDRDNKNQHKEFAFTPANVNSKVRGMLHLMMSMPEYQLA